MAAASGVRVLLELDRGAARGCEPIARLDPVEWESRIRVLTNMPVRRVYPIRNMYLQAIDQAAKSIYISTAYFIPDQQILDA